MVQVRAESVHHSGDSLELYGCSATYKPDISPLLGPRVFLSADHTYMDTMRDNSSDLPEYPTITIGHPLRNHTISTILSETSLDFTIFVYFIPQNRRWWHRRGAGWESVTPDWRVRKQAINIITMLLLKKKRIHSKQLDTPHFTVIIQNNTWGSYFFLFLYSGTESVQKL